MPNSKRTNRRLHYAALGVFTALVAGCLGLASNEALIDQLSIGSAYICVLLMVIALAIGPVQTMRTGLHLPINRYLRRDIGIWAALCGWLHLFVATGQAMNAAYIDQYVAVSHAGIDAPARQALFLWGSVAAYIIGLLLLLLLSISSDRALQLLGPRWWKRLQRTAYLVFGLTVIHALMFQLLESRSLMLIVFVGVLAGTITVLQILGFLVVQRNRGVQKE